MVVVEQTFRHLLQKVCCVLSTQIFVHIDENFAMNLIPPKFLSLKLTADPGVASSIPARSHTFVEIDHEIISTVILLPSAVFIQEGLLSVTSESMCTNYWLTAYQACPGKSVVR